MYIDIYVYINTCIYMYILIHVYICIYVYINLCIYTRHLGSLTAANWVSFEFDVFYSSC